MPRRSNRRKRANGGMAGKGDRAVNATQGRVNAGGSRVSLTRIGATGGVSDTARVTLRYVQELSLSSTTGAYGSNVFRGNGPFDPDQSGTGAQPVWYDDYSAMYNRYRCLGSRISVEAAMSTNTGLSMVLGITPQHQTTSMATVSFALAQPYTAVSSVSAYTPMRTMSQVLSTAKYLGYPAGGMMGSDALESLYSTVPSHQWYWHVWTRSTDGSSSLTATVWVTIDYDLLWFDKVDGALDFAQRLEQFTKAGRVVALAKPDEKSEPTEYQKRLHLLVGHQQAGQISSDEKKGVMEDGWELADPPNNTARQTNRVPSVLTRSPGQVWRSDESARMTAVAEQWDTRTPSAKISLDPRKKDQKGA